MARPRGRRQRHGPRTSQRRWGRGGSGRCRWGQGRDIADRPGGDQGFGQPGITQGSRPPGPPVTGTLGMVTTGRGAAIGGQAGQAVVRPGDDDQVGLLGGQCHRPREEHWPAQLAGQQLGQVVAGHDRTSGDRGDQPPPRRREARARQDAPQRGGAPGHRGGVQREGDAQDFHGHARRGGSPGQVADARRRPRQQVRARPLVAGDVQPFGRPELAGGFGVSRDPGHRCGTVTVSAQHLAALGRQPRRLGRGQAARPDQAGELAQAVAHRGDRRDADQVQGAQPGERCGQRP